MKNDYYKQVVDIERIKNVKLENDIATIQDFKPEGMQVDWKHVDLDWQGNPSAFYEYLWLDPHLSNPNIHITLYRTREGALEGYTLEKDRRPFNHTQTEIKNNLNDAICISKVARLRDSDFCDKTNQYYSQVTILKNNMVISIYCYAHNENTGSSKQALIDIAADYLEKCAAKESIH